MDGGESISERREIIREHKIFMTEKIRAYQKLLRLIDKKLEFYDEALDTAGSEAASCMDYESEWKHFRSIIGGVMDD